MLAQVYPLSSSWYLFYIVLYSTKRLNQHYYAPMPNGGWARSHQNIANVFETHFQQYLLPAILNCGHTNILVLPLLSNPIYIQSINPIYIQSIKEHEIKEVLLKKFNFKKFPGHNKNPFERTERKFNAIMRLNQFSMF